MLRAVSCGKPGLPVTAGMRTFRALLAVILLGLVLGHAPEPACAQGQACPPGTRVDTAAAQTLKAQLKARMAREGVPPRLQELVDKLPDCPACIERARLQVVSAHDRASYEAGEERRQSINRAFGAQVAGGSTNAVGDNVFEAVEWSPTNEAIARRGLRSGRIKAFFVTLLSGPCICCPEGRDRAEAWQRAGGFDGQIYRQSPQLFNADVASGANSASGLGEDPADLYELDPSLTAAALDGEIVARPVPNLPPAVRTAQPLCPHCRALAAERNTLADRYNDLRDSYAADYAEADRLLRLYVSRAGEIARQDQLVTRGGEANADARDRADLIRDRDHIALLTQANALFDKARATLAELEALRPDLERLDARLLACDTQPCAPPPATDGPPPCPDGSIVAPGAACATAGPAGDTTVVLEQIVPLSGFQPFDQPSLESQFAPGGTSTTGGVWGNSIGSYSGDGSCGINSTSLALFSNQCTLDPFGANGPTRFNCASSPAPSFSSTIIILGGANHSCTLRRTNDNRFVLDCTNTGGGTCSEPFNRSGP